MLKIEKKTEKVSNQLEIVISTNAPQLIPATDKEMKELKMSIITNF